MTFEELQQSLKTLGLCDRSTMKQIKARHRELGSNNLGSSLNS